MSSPVLLPSGSGAGQLSHSHRTDRPHGSPAGAGHVLSSRLPIQLFKSSTPTRLLSTFPGSENSFTDQTRDFIYQLGPCQPLCLPVSSVQSLSRVRFFATPWTAARQASLSITNLRSLLKHMSSASVMPSSHLILCHPLLLPPSIFPSIRVFSIQQLFP